MPDEGDAAQCARSIAARIKIPSIQFALEAVVADQAAQDDIVNRAGGEKFKNFFFLAGNEKLRRRRLAGGRRARAPL
jgi:hypothetical protein